MKWVRFPRSLGKSVNKTIMVAIHMEFRGVKLK